MKKYLIVASTLTLLLTGCGEATQKESKDSDNTVSEVNNAKEKSSENKKEISKKQSVKDISEEMKIALAFFTENAKKYTLSKDEILTGVYDYEGMTGTEKKQLYKLFLINEKNFDEAPKGMKFYSVYPAKGSYASILGISTEKLFVGGTQGATTYKELLETGDEYNIQDIYDKNKDLTSLPELAKKIVFTKTHPMSDEKTQKEILAKENSGTNGRARTEVYQKITEFEGQPIDTKKYLVDNVKFKDDGNWKVNYRNKDAEIVGTYMSKGDKVIKLDDEGKKIK